MQTMAEKLISQLELSRNEKKAAWLSNYVKHGVQSYGIGIPELRKMLLQNLADKKNFDNPKVEEEFLSSLMQHSFTEPKLLAILYLQIHHKTLEAEKTLALVEKWFDREWIFDWNVCDWLCVRVLSPILDQHHANITPEVHKNASKYLGKK